MILASDTISDIVMVDRKIITNSTKHGTQHPDRQSSLSWPRQSQPEEAAWTMWWNMLGRLEANGRLIQPLGKWIAPTHQIWKWFRRPHSAIV